MILKFVKCLRITWLTSVQMKIRALDSRLKCKFEIRALNWQLNWVLWSSCFYIVLTDIPTQVINNRNTRVTLSCLLKNGRTLKILRCEHWKICKVRLAIFQHYAWKGKPFLYLVKICRNHVPGFSIVDFLCWYVTRRMETSMSVYKYIPVTKTWNNATEFK